jgi:hypothetical protein
MKRGLILLASLVLVAAGCSSGSASDAGIATLDESDSSTTTTSATDTDADAEQAMLDFAWCMRDNGLPDFPDPVVNSDGSMSMGIGGPDGSSFDPGSEEFQTAMQACGDLLQGVALGADRGQFDPTELQDQLLAVAGCLRDEGYDVTDPQLDFSGGGPAGGERGPTTGSTTDGQTGPSTSGVFSIFGPNFVMTDPDSQAALQACADSLGFDTFGSSGVGGSGEPPPDGGTTGTASGS